MIPLAEALAATEPARALRNSVWVYPLVNAAHILGIALLVGAVVPMDLRLLGLRGAPTIGETLALLRPMAVAGLILAGVTGACLFAVRADAYIANPWFQAKAGLVALALANIAGHRQLVDQPAARRRIAAGLSLALWPAVLLAGRMIGYR